MVQQPPSVDRDDPDAGGIDKISKRYDIIVLNDMFIYWSVFLFVTL